MGGYTPDRANPGREPLELIGLKPRKPTAGRDVPMAALPSANRINDTKDSVAAGLTGLSRGRLPATVYKWIRRVSTLVCRQDGEPARVVCTYVFHLIGRARLII